MVQQHADLKRKAQDEDAGDGEMQGMTVEYGDCGM